MKEQNEIDQLFEQQLGNISVEPSAASWDKITSSLDAAASSGSNFGGRKRLFLYALIGTVAAITAYVLFFNQGRSRNINPTQNPIVEISKPILAHPKTQTDKPVLVNKQIDNSQTNVTPISVENSSQNTPSIKANSPEKALNETKENGLNHQAVKHDVSLVKENKKNANVNNTPQQENKTALVYSTGTDTENFEEDKQTQEVSKLETNTQSVEASEENVTLNNTVAQSKEVTKEETASVSAVSANQKAEKVSEVQQTTEMEITEKTEVTESSKKVKKEELAEPIKSTESPVQAVTESKENTQEIEKSDDIDQKYESTGTTSPTETAGLHHATGWSIDAFVGPAIIQSNAEVIPPKEEFIYQTDMDQKITTPNMGIHIKFHFDNWFVQSGIDYAEYGENKEYSQKIEMHDTSGFANQNIADYYTYDTTGWIPDPNNSGVLIPVFDAVHHSDTSYSWTTEDSMYYEHQAIYAQNRFRYIEIPAMLGYEFRFKNLGVSVATGISVGFRVNSSGKFLDSGNNLVDINPSNSPYSNTMMNYILTVGVKYHLSNRLSILAQPIYKTNLNSILKSGLGSDIRYSSFGVNVGVNYIIK